MGVQERQLPFGFACIAIRDDTYPGFPTFPVMHKLHFSIFGQLFPDELRNQHGDPFLFEIYRRWGASRFAGAASTQLITAAVRIQMSSTSSTECVLIAAILQREPDSTVLFTSCHRCEGQRHYLQY
jgi:hypothetical protein